MCNPWSKHPAALGPAAALGALLLAWPAAGGSAAAEEPPARPVCRTLAAIVGPEDVEVDPSTAPPRLLVSSQDRRGGRESWPPGAIYAVDPAASPGPDAMPRRLRLVGRDSCSFHPHGISLAAVGPEGERTWLLYVVNHHDAGDASPQAGCLPAAPEAGAGRVTSVEVFAVERDRLAFVQRLADPAVLTNANDLVAVGDGSLWVTDPPPGAWGQLRELLFARNVESKVVHFACEERLGVRCRGRWDASERLGRYVNGIAYRAAAPGRGRLWVASTLEDRLHVLDVAGSKVERVSTIAAPRGLDNLSWLDPERTVLLAAGHPDLRRFFQHALSPEVSSPSEVFRIGVAGDPPQRLWSDDGSQLSASSAAVRWDDDLIVGQVFGSRLLACALTAREWSHGRAEGGEAP